MKQFHVATITTLMMETSKVGIPMHLHMDFFPKIEDMDLGKSNLTHLTPMDLQHEIRVKTIINNSFETTNFCLDFRANEDEFEKYETWVLSIAY
jgi:hypothetical protein